MYIWSFLYQYSIGGAFFLLFTYLAVRSRSIDPGTRPGRRQLAILLGGLVLYAAVHALSVFVLPLL